MLSDVVSSRDKISAEFSGILEKCFEFYLAIAEYVWVRRPARRILLEKVLEHIVPVFGCEIRAM